jgi:8-hydroxy-5-deazaflavin:NADPH oxidoreductase
LATAIIGVGNLGGTVARHLVAGDEHVVLAAHDEKHAETLASELGPNATAASVDEAIADADVVVLATWLDQTRELAPTVAPLLENKIVVDPSNPIAVDEKGQLTRTLPQGQSAASVVAGLLPESVHFVKALGSLGAIEQLATSANRNPRVVLFYATDDDAAEAAAQRLIRAAGFEPLKVGGLSDAARIEGPDGELQGQIFDLDEARAVVATEGVQA